MSPEASTAQRRPMRALAASMARPNSTSVSAPGNGKATSSTGPS